MRIVYTYIYIEKYFCWGLKNYESPACVCIRMLPDMLPVSELISMWQQIREATNLEGALSLD